MEKNMNSMLNQSSESGEDTMLGKYLTFIIDSQLYGVPIADVVQIIGMQEITAIPEFPYYAKGIINLRGEIIPVIDIRLRFNKPEIAYNERTCIIVTNIKENYIGFIVDEVDEVTDISDEQVSPPPAVAGETEGSYLTGIGKLDGKVVLLMETALMLSEQSFDSITGLGGEF